MLELREDTKKTTEWLELAKKRVKIPEGKVELRYFDEVDCLVIRLSHHKPAKSDAEEDKGLVYSFDSKNNLVSIEILDLYGIFVTA